MSLQGQQEFKAANDLFARATSRDAKDPRLFALWARSLYYEGQQKHGMCSERDNSVFFVGLASNCPSPMFLLVFPHFFSSSRLFLTYHFMST